MKPMQRDSLTVVGAYLVAAAAAIASVALTAYEQPLATAAVADLVATLVIFVASVAANNSSMYDPYWSVAPPLLTLYWLGSYGHVSPGALLLLALIVLWGVRLTANWASRWRGAKDEDWRYREFRANSGPLYWLVSLAAIHLFPTAVVFLGLLPVHGAMATPQPPLSPTIALGLLLTAAAIGLESTADRQLRAHRRRSPDTLCRSGVWGTLRHPNYIGELGFWLGLFVTSVGLGAPLWTGVGFIAMCGVFFGYSIPAMNRHLREKRRSTVPTRED